jgi:hypothetical protein
MKTLFKILVISAVALGMSCCAKKEITPGEKEKEGHSIVVNTGKQWNTFDPPAYVGDISWLPADLQKVIQSRFPRHADISESAIVFLSAAEVAAHADELKEAIEEDAFIVYPENVDMSKLGLNNQQASFMDPNEYSVLFHCSSNYGMGLHYTMWEEPENTEIEDEESDFTDAEWAELMEKNKALGEESGVILSDYDNEPDHNENYYQTRIDPFVDWLENCIMEQILTKSTPFENVKAIVEQSGQRFTHNFPYSLNKTIDKATGSDPDVLNKNGSLDAEFRVFPFYMQSSNGQHAGDYYIVVSHITPHNASMWGPFVGKHGWCRNRVYGYWFNTMEVTTSLLNKDNSSIAGLQYYERPIPENKNSSKQYSNGKTTSMSGTINGGYGGKSAGLTLTGSFSLGASWTSSTNYTLETISFSLDSSTPDVKYKYWSENVKLTDHYDDWNKINNEDYPAPVRTEFTAHTSWTWFIPSSQVKDGDTKSFKLKTNIKLNYSSWYHWRAAAEFDSNRKNYDINLPAISWDLTPPNRTPWGFINLRNATSNEMSHVKYFKSGEETGKPVAQLTTSYGKGQEAIMALPEGTYSVTWDIINGDTSEKLGSYIYKNVKVHQGADKASATVSISSVDGEKQ